MKPGFYAAESYEVLTGGYVFVPIELSDEDFWFEKQGRVWKLYDGWMYGIATNKCPLRIKLSSSASPHHHLEMVAF